VDHVFAAVANRDRSGASYVGDRFAGTDNLRVAPDYWTFDAMLSKQFGKNVKAQLNVYN